jgi:ankyrin repeat protein
MQGADVNAHNEDCTSPLHITAFANSARVAGLLIEKGAKVADIYCFALLDFTGVDDALKENNNPACY